MSSLPASMVKATGIGEGQAQEDAKQGINHGLTTNTNI